MEGAEVLLCVTGGIACYKSADLASKLTQAGAGVSVAMTDAAGRFVTPLTFQTITGRCVFNSLWQAGKNYESGHLSLTEQADLMIVAPATADIIAKMAVGIADDLVSTLALSAWGGCGILIAPAMNTRMFQAPPTRDNIQKLADRGVHIVGPNEGRLACGTVGIGRMAEPDEILAAAEELLKKS
ncbi:MAG: phosphopantothenoylcysteine decarboxylase [Phycisphaerae bacterium]|nr:phosphopantothenoylcysteine decarboxylase [Phycisphaerae bacterium]